MMATAWDKETVCRVCLSLALVLAMVSPGQTAGEAGQSGTASVLSRVQQESDPELSELIRIAMANRQESSDQERFEIVCKITQSYAQVKLLDQQIDQVGQKLEATTGPADLRYELLLARAELESKRTTELATLREIMGIVPRFPFDKQPTGDLNTWLNLQVLDQRVVVYDGLKPFEEYWAMWRHNVAGVLSEQGTLDYIRGRLKDRKNLPMRITINYRSESRSASERLREAVFSLARETHTDMDVEVRMELNWWASATLEAPFFCREGKIRTLYSAATARPDGRPTLFQKGLVVVDPNDLEQHVLWRLTYPGNLPISLRVECDQASAPLARQVVETFKTTAQRLGVAELVAVRSVPVEPVPETPFLGRWEALRKGFVQAIDIQPQGVCQLIIGEGSDTLQSGASVKGTWMPLCKGIFVDVSERSRYGAGFYYLASINQNGNLVVDRTELYIQGCFHMSNTGQSILQKVK